MSQLYPPIQPFETVDLPVGEGHVLYVERCGRRGGDPIVFLHGGPGSGATADHRRLFDPARFEIIIFDQRGAGRSRPQGAIDHNDTARLVADMEAIRRRFGHDRWRVAGGSWGATLALAYADVHPTRVQGVAVYGVFLCRRAEIDAFYGPSGPAAALFPDAYADFVAPLAPGERADPVAAYGRLFDAPEPETRDAALRAWTAYEKRLSRLVVTDEMLERDLSDPAYVAAHSRIENWYFRHEGFIDGDAILSRAGVRLEAAPVEIVAGRYDVVTPPITAWELAKAAPHAQLVIAPSSGHSVKEPEVTEAFMAAISRI